MIRTLVILAIVSFVLSIGCLAAAFAIAGGPFTIDDGWRFHHGDWNIDISAASSGWRSASEGVPGRELELTEGIGLCERSARA